MMDPTTLDAAAKDPTLVEAGRRAIEDTLVEWRDARLSEPWRGNGLVCRERDGSDSHIIRFGPETALAIGLKAMAAELRRRADDAPSDP